LVGTKKRAEKQSRFLAVLDRFAKSYVPKISVRFGDGHLGRASGQSDIERKIVYLSSKQELRPDAIGLGLSYAYRIGPKYRSMKLTRHEMFFLTLLHEIGHFKIKEAVPENYRRLKRDIIPEANRDRLIELSIIESRIKRKRGESQSAWELRLADFMNWLMTGETITHHMKVENWAIDELERKKRSIAKLLSDAGF